MDPSNLTFHSESDVEQKLITPLLTEDSAVGLGYSPWDFRTKVDIRKLTVGKGTSGKLYYPDYAIVISGLPVLIVEAKAPGEDLNEAFREARLYASEINSRYPHNINPCCRIVATNGEDIVCGKWDEEHPRVAMAVLDISSISADYEEIKQLASKRATEALAREFLQRIRGNTKYIRPVDMLGGQGVANQSVGQNSFGANVSVEYKYLFNPDDRRDRDAVATKAYVPSKRRLSHVSPIDKIIRAASPLSVVNSRPIEDLAVPDELFGAIRDRSLTRNEICLLVGSVGSGKSTFVDYLRLVALPEDLRNATEWIHINLNNAPLNRDQIYEWFLEEAASQIQSQHSSIDFDELATLKRVYARLLSTLEKGPLALLPEDSPARAERVYDEMMRWRADGKLTFECLLDHLYVGQNILPLIVLDNCDKRSRDDQLLVFQVANWVKSTFSCSVILPVRDSTYDNYHDEPPLDTVIKDLVFRIDPPALERVIYSRLRYALREIESEQKDFQYSVPNGATVVCKRSEVSEYLKCLVSSLFQDQLFKRIVTGLAGRNIRRGLEIFLDFCKSGHLSETEILKARANGGDYLIPRHIVSRILMKGKRRYYKDEAGFIKNVFSSRADEDLPNPFTRTDILSWLRAHDKEKGPNQTVGFHKVGTLISDLQALGDSTARVLEEIDLLAKAGCLRTESYLDTISEDDLIAIAPGGYVHLDLTKNVDYLAMVAEDTLFRTTNTAKRIADNLVSAGRFSFGTRAASLDSALTLVDYLGDYERDTLVGRAQVLIDDVVEDLFRIEDIRGWLAKKRENDPVFSEIEEHEVRFPPGSVVSGTITSIKKFGLFIHLDPTTVGFLSRESAGHQWRDISRDLEPGDAIDVEITRYNFEHRKFEVALP